MLKWSAGARWLLCSRPWRLFYIALLGIDLSLQSTLSMCEHRQIRLCNRESCLRFISRAERSHERWKEHFYHLLLRAVTTGHCHVRTPVRHPFLAHRLPHRCHYPESQSSGTRHWRCSRRTRHSLLSPEPSTGPGKFRCPSVNGPARKMSGGPFTLA